MCWLVGWFVNPKLVCEYNVNVHTHVQAMTGDGRWIKTEPSDNSLIVMVGDLIQRWTANRLLATVSTCFALRNRYFMGEGGAALWATMHLAPSTILADMFVNTEEN